jgi:hypothetical protein
MRLSNILKFFTAGFMSVFDFSPRKIQRAKPSRMEKNLDSASSYINKAFNEVRNNENK